MSHCNTCKYFGDYSYFGLGLRCINKHNKPNPKNFMVVPSNLYSCSRYKQNDLTDRFEWDDNKNELNKRKHGIGFDRAIDIYLDPNQIQMPEIPEKWEKINEKEFEVQGIEKNEGNLDPVRGKIVGRIDGTLYTFIYTFRHDFGDLTYRVISLRRAHDNEILAYESFERI